MEIPICQHGLVGVMVFELGAISSSLLRKGLVQTNCSLCSLNGLQCGLVDGIWAQGEMDIHCLIDNVVDKAYVPVIYLAIATILHRIKSHHRQ